VAESNLPPYDINAEESVNGSLLIDGKAIYDVAIVLKAEDFYSEQNSQILTYGIERPVPTGDLHDAP
jgi:replicative DNA helicase